MTVSGTSTVYLSTTEGEFSIPFDLIKRNQLSGILRMIATCIKTDYSRDDFLALAAKPILKWMKAR